MSLVAFAARKSLCMLLRGATWAGDRVRDAPIEPLDSIMDGDAARPMIAVFTGAYSGDVTGRELIGAKSKQDFVLQLYFPPVTSDEEGSDLDGWYPHPLAGAAPALDILKRQVFSVMQSATGPWAEIYRRLVARYETVRDDPILIEVEKSGLRVPCREITLRGVPVGDPPIGMPLEGAFLDFKNMLTLTEPELAEVFRQAAESPSDMPDWRKTMAAMGWSERTAKLLGVKPETAETDDDGNPIEITAVTVDGGLEVVQPDLFGEQP